MKFPKLATGTRNAAAKRQNGTKVVTGSREPDEVLVRRCLEGDRQDLFGQLFRRHHRGILNYVFRMTGDYERALELTQEIFIKAFQSLHQFNPRSRFTTWIYHIASHRTIDFLRKRKPRYVSMDIRDSQPPPRCIQGLRSPGPSPYEELRVKELGQSLQEAIDGLPPSYRDLIVLRHFNHLRYDEIARIRGLPLGTVKNRIFRARELLRRAVR